MGPHVWNLNPRRKYLDNKGVIAAIRRRKRNRQAINARGLTHGDHQDAPLLYSGRKLFGGWPEAVRAAGIGYESVVRNTRCTIRDRVGDQRYCISAPQYPHCLRLC